jgi:hypothetical protein
MVWQGFLGVEQETLTTLGNSTGTRVPVGTRVQVSMGMGRVWIWGDLPYPPTLAWVLGSVRVHLVLDRIPLRTIE